VLALISNHMHDSAGEEEDEETRGAGRDHLPSLSLSLIPCPLSFQAHTYPHTHPTHTHTHTSVAGDFIVAWDPSPSERENFGRGNARRNLTIAGVFADEKAERS
jgi:hypothetical protein